MNLPIFDGGRLSANERQAKAEFEEASAQYRSQVLKAVREVEDNLAQLRDLQQEAQDEQAAADAAQHTQSLAMNSYQAGAVSYLDVVTAQTAALQAQRDIAGGADAAVAGQCRTRDGTRRRLATWRLTSFSDLTQL